MTEGERLKAIRKTKELTLKEFGSYIGVSDSAVSQMEKGKINMSEQTRVLVCTQFRVRDEWLRTGEGEMFIRQDLTAQLSHFFGEVTSDIDGSLRKRLITALAKLNEDDWAALSKILEKMTKDPE